MHLRDLSQFLRELEANNNRAWFVMNRPRYDILREEFLHTVSELLQQIGRFDPLIRTCNPKKALFRINRDVRFSGDKSPYKTVFSAAMVPDDLKRPSSGAGPCYYIQLDGAGKMLFGGGNYMPPPERLRAIRQHLIDDSAGFMALLKHPALKKTYGDLETELKLTRVPKGFDANHALAEYLKLKSFFVHAETLAPVDQPEKLVPDLTATMQAALPLVQWLRSVPMRHDTA